MIALSQFIANCYYFHNFAFTIGGLSFSATWRFISATCFFTMHSMLSCCSVITSATQAPSRCTITTYPYSYMYHVVSRLYSCYMLCYFVHLWYRATASLKSFRHCLRLHRFIQLCLKTASSCLKFALKYCYYAVCLLVNFDKPSLVQ